ncbi:MAG: VOC family protein [Anaerolineae bacterium]|nr:VOC family protein [Anaerolineae bacterium]
MFKVTKYPHGTFSWADCGSTDPAKSKAFYTALMGWTAEDMPLGENMFYTMFKQDGLNVAGLGPLMVEGMPSVWSSYVSVDNVDAISTKVKELGGTVMMEPMDVFDSGRMMMLQDPTGAVLGAWQPKNHIGASLVNTPGAMTWNELTTRDLAKAKDFYTKLFVWETSVDATSGYTTFLNNGRSNGGVMQMDESWGDMPPVWSVYFSVADIDATIAKVEPNGGKVIMGKTDAGGIGVFAVIADPTGAVCSFIQLKEPQPWNA